MGTETNPFNVKRPVQPQSAPAVEYRKPMASLKEGFITECRDTFTKDQYVRLASKMSPVFGMGFPAAPMQDGKMCVYYKPVISSEGLLRKMHGELKSKCATYAGAGSQAACKELVDGVPSLFSKEPESTKPSSSAPINLHDPRRIKPWYKEFWVARGDGCGNGFDFGVGMAIVAGIGLAARWVYRKIKESKDHHDDPQDPPTPVGGPENNPVGKTNSDGAPEAPPSAEPVSERVWDEPFVPIVFDAPRTLDYTNMWDPNDFQVMQYETEKSRRIGDMRNFVLFAAGATLFAVGVAGTIACWMDPVPEPVGRAALPALAKWGFATAAGAYAMGLFDSDEASASPYNYYSSPMGNDPWFESAGYYSSLPSADDSASAYSQPSPKVEKKPEICEDRDPPKVEDYSQYVCG